jgi:homoserine kinase
MSFTVVVPCSTSNLGAGFDALGIALGGPDLIVRVTPGGSGLRIARLSGAGADSLPRDKSNRIVEAAFAAARLGGRDPESLSAELEVHSAIPLRRGLGSSAAAALAGALLADALSGGALGEPRVLAAAVALEGHPDNVVPSLRGGAQVALLDAAGAVRSCEVRIGTALKAALFIPDVELSTSEARAVLPKSVPLADAVHNLARSALFVAALSQGRIELFAEAMDDRLHQPARATLIPWLPEVIAEARAAGAYGAALSGAGTTVVALCGPDAVKRVAQRMSERAAKLGLTGTSEVVDVGVPGARVQQGAFRAGAA